MLYETRYEHAEYDGGLFVNDDSQLEARGEAVYSAGEIQPALTAIKCESCGHEWHTNWRFIGIQKEEGRR
jgi:hypothetical protein